jgi:hypothetical protein
MVDQKSQKSTDKKDKRKYRKVKPNETQILRDVQRASLAVRRILENAGIYPKFSKREQAIIAAVAPHVKPLPARKGRPKGDGAPIQDAMQSFGIANRYFAMNGGKRTKAYIAAGVELGRSEHTIKSHCLAARKYFVRRGIEFKKNHLDGLSLDGIQPGSVEYWEIFLSQHYRG